MLLPYFSFSPSSSSSGQNPSLRADQAYSQFKWSNFGALLEPETRVIPVAEMKGIRCQRSASALRTKCHEAVFSPRLLHRASPGKVGKRETTLMDVKVIQLFHIVCPSFISDQNIGPFSIQCSALSGPGPKILYKYFWSWP